MPNYYHPRSVKFSRFTPKIGERIMAKPYISKDRVGHTICGRVPGTIVYINVPHRFYVAEFDFNGRKIREAVKFAVRSDFACLVPKPKIEDTIETENRTVKSRRVRDLSTGKIYASIREAASETGISRAAIGQYCRNERKKPGGNKWEYVDEPPKGDE